MFFLRLKRILVFSLVAAGTYFFVLSCDNPNNPFSANLGSKVDVSPPTINVTFPKSGAFIKDSLRITGVATAYREVTKVEIKILSQYDSEEPLLDWTSEGIIFIDDDNPRKKTWYFDLDTVKRFYHFDKDTENNDITVPGLDDNFLKILFKAHDPNLETISNDGQPYLFIVKNKPSVVKMTQPNDIQLSSLDGRVPLLVTGSEISGQIIDKRGIKPGYPQIKLWPADMNEPKDDDINWGYVSLFLTGFENPDNPEGNDGAGYYADRTNMPVVNVANFSFKLAEYTIETVTLPGKTDQDPRWTLYQAKYAGGGNIPLEPKYYNFRIKTSDSYFYDEPENTTYTYLHPRQAAGAGEKEIIGDYPPLQAIKPYTVQLVAYEEPTIYIDNTDKEDAELLATPNIFITDPTSKKIAVEGKTLFRLRVLAKHSAVIDSEKTTVKWRHDGTARGSIKTDTYNTPWDNPDGLLSWDRPDGDLKDPASDIAGKLFTLTVNAGMTDGAGNKIFSNNADPYTLMVETYSTSGAKGSREFTLYLDGDGPVVSIRNPMKGSYKEPAASATSDGIGTINSDPYIVNGNIQVSIDTSAGMGIMKDSTGRNKIKWFVEDRAAIYDVVAGTLVPQEGTTYKQLQDFRKDPSAAKLQFFEDIDESPVSGWVNLPSSAPGATDADKTNNFKFNTVKGAVGANEWNQKDLWLYVIAQDSIQNLNYCIQKLYVDDVSDAPMYNSAAPANPLPMVIDLDPSINTREKLFNAGGASGADYGNTEMKNVLGSHNSVTLNFLDDDGISIDKGNVTITITDVNRGAAGAISNTDLKNSLSGKSVYENGSSTEWIGTMNQVVMANALGSASSRYDNNNNVTGLKDGIYTISITVEENIDVKVAINRTPPQPGDAPEATAVTQKYFFAVYADEPEIIIDSRHENGAVVRDEPVTVYGRVKSSFKIQKLNILFTPDFITPENYTNASPKGTWPADLNDSLGVLSLYKERTGTGDNAADYTDIVTVQGEVERDPLDGKYVYYWYKANVNFDPWGSATHASGPPAGDVRIIEMVAIDGLNYSSDTKRVRMEVDSTPPDITLPSFNYNRGGGAVNGKIHMVISVYEQNSLMTDETGPKIKWWILPSGSPGALSETNPSAAMWNQPVPTANAAGGRLPDSTYGTVNEGYVAIFNSTTVANDSYDLWVYAEDYVSNISVKKLRTFTVDQSADIPTLAAGEDSSSRHVSTANNPNTLVYLGNTDNIISVIVNDDDQFNSAKTAKQYVQLRFPSDPAFTPNSNTNWGGSGFVTTAGLPDEAFAGSTVDLDSVLFKFDMTRHDYFAADGQKYFQIIVSDEPAPGATPGGSSSANYGKNPDGVTSGPNYLGAATKVFPSDAQDRGFYTFYLKTTTPVVTFTTAGGSYYNSLTSLKNALGNSYVTDSMLSEDLDAITLTYGADTVNLEHSARGANNRYTFFRTASGNEADWPATISGLFDGNHEGVHTIKITARDIVGNVGWADWQFTIDSTGPEGTVNNIDTPIKGDAGSVFIRGVFNDTYSEIKSTFTFQFDDRAAQTVSISGDYGEVIGRRANWHIPIPGEFNGSGTNGLADGAHTITISIQDILGNETTLGPLTFIVDRQRPLVSEADNMMVTGNGNNLIGAAGSFTQRRLPESERVFSASGVSGWLNNTNPASDTVFTLNGIVYEHNLDSLTVELVSNFSTSQAIDSIALTGAEIAIWKAAAVPSEWLVNAAGNLRIRKAVATDFGAADDQYVSLETTPSLAIGSQYVWELKLTKGDFYKLLYKTGTTFEPYGKFRVTLQAKDLAGRDSVEAKWDFFLDNTPPRIQYQNAVEKSESAKNVFSTINLQMIVSDETNIQAVRYRLQKYDYTATTANKWRYYSGGANGNWNATTPTPATDLPSLLPSGSLPWTSQSITLDSTALAASNNTYPATLLNTEGWYKLELYVTDFSLSSNTADAGNPTVGEYVVFHVDAANPTLTAIPTMEFRNFGKLEFNLNVADANTIAGVRVQMAGTPTVVYTVTTGTASDGGIISWPDGLANGNLHIAIPSTSFTNENKYTLTITVTDGAGKQTTQSTEFTLDNTAPTITLSDKTAPNNSTITPPAQAILAAITGRNELKGSVTKSAGLAKVKRVAYAIVGTGAVPPVTGDLTDDLVITNHGWKIYASNTVDETKYSWGYTYPATATGNKLIGISDNNTSPSFLIPNTRFFNGSGLLGATITAADANTANITFNGNALTDVVDELKIYILAVDEAGNFNTAQYTYYVYPEGDRPKANFINNPKRYVNNAATPPVLTIDSERLLNGRIRISGIATDNSRVQKVWFRVMEGNNPTTATLQIPQWNSDWEAVTNAAGAVVNQTARELRDYNNVSYGNGWFQANGGGSSTVSWYAYINTNGELDPPSGSNSRSIRLEVMAEDTIFLDHKQNTAGGYGAWGESVGGNGVGVASERGMFSARSTTITGNPPGMDFVNAFVVTGAPRFEDEEVFNGKSANAGTAWRSVSETYLRGRAAYRITVKHETGLSALRWIRGGGLPTIDLLDGTNAYNTSDYAAHLAAMDSSPYNATTNPGIAVRAGPKNPVTSGATAGTHGVVSGRRYMIWNPDTALVTAPSLLPTGDENRRYTRFTAGANRPNIGNAILIEEKNGVYEWEVVVDLNSLILPGPPPWANRADFYSLDFTAIENSLATPLPSSKTVDLPIDNVPPEAMYSYSTRVAGSAPYFGGVAGDGDTNTAVKVKGISKVVLWFSRNVNIGGTTYAERSIPWEELRADGTVLRTHTAFQSGTTPAGINYPGGVTIPTGVNVPAEFTSDNTTTTANISSIVIDRNDTLGSTPHHGHQYSMGFATIGGDLSTSWYVVLDSTLMVSGRTTAHYLVYDKAGNITYGKRDLMILNNIPIIKTITLGTDARGIPTGTAGTLAQTGNTSGTTTSVFDSKFGGLTTDGNPATIHRSKGVAIDTTKLGDYGPVYDIPFNARNNLLGFKIALAKPAGTGKPRFFRVEYVSGGANAAITNGTDATGDVGVGYVNASAIRAGRIYMINNPGTNGTNQFPWGAFGAQGDEKTTYRTGFVFLALENGENIRIPGTVASYGNPTVWELTTATSGNNKITDVSYPSGVGDNGEFIFGSNAFGTNLIRNFTALVDAAGRPLPYPANTANNAQLWNNHSLFAVRVFDRDTGDNELLGDFALLAIRVNNADQTRSFAQLYDLNPKTEGVEVNTRTPAQARAPEEMGGNRTKGGLWNTVESIDTINKSGHIEPRAATSLTSADMGGASSERQATIYKPVADPRYFFATDTVSGKVILRGYAEDDQRIGRVTVQFGSDDEINILTSRTPVTADNLLQAAANATVSFVEDLSLFRHRVEWAYEWDTETIPANTVVGNINVTVRAYTFNGITTASSVYARGTGIPPGYNYFNPDFPDFDPAYVEYDKNFLGYTEGTAAVANARRYNQIPVNLRPYIVGFTRDNRSLQGRYMFAQGETGVTLTGFNLGGTGTTTTIYIPTKVYNANNSNPILRNAQPGTTNTGGVNSRTFNIPAYDTTLTPTPAVNAVTGDGMVTLTVTRGGTAYESVNTGSERRRYNINTNAVVTITPANQQTPATVAYKAQPWNTQRAPQKDGSDLWDDFTALYIWQSRDTGTTAVADGGAFPSQGNNWTVLNPSMSVNPATGTLYESHNENGAIPHPADGATNYNTGSSRITTNDTTYVERRMPATPSGNTGDGRSNQYNSADDTAANSTIRTSGRFGDPLIMSDVYYSSGGTGAANVWSSFAVIGRVGTAQHWAGLGGIFVSGPGGTTFNFYNALNANFYMVESNWYNGTDEVIAARRSAGSITDQFKNPHVVVGDGQHIHVAYYDRKDGSMKYRYNLRGSAGTITSGTEHQVQPAATTGHGIPKMWTNLDGGVDWEDLDQTTYTAAAVGTGNIAAGARMVGYTSNYGTQSRNTLSTGTSNVTTFSDANYATIRATRGANANAGEHNAIALTRSGFPVVAYYDEYNQRLKLAVSNSTSPILSNRWVIRDNVIPTDDLSHTGTGKYVSIAIDTRAAGNEGIIHIAAMNSLKNQLVYITGQLNTFTGTTGNRTETSGGVLTNVEVRVVDSVGVVGTWSNISLDENGRPWIAYMDVGGIGTRNGAKVAYLNGDTFKKALDDTSGKLITGWETMHVPLQWTVNNPNYATGGESGRLGFECYPTPASPTGATPKFWGAALAYMANDRYRIAYFVK